MNGLEREEASIGRRSRTDWFSDDRVFHKHGEGPWLPRQTRNWRRVHPVPEKIKIVGRNGILWQTAVSKTIEVKATAGLNPDV